MTRCFETINLNKTSVAKLTCLFLRKKWQHYIWPWPGIPILWISLRHTYLSLTQPPWDILTLSSPSQPGVHLPCLQPAWGTLILSSASLGYTYLVFSQPGVHLPCLQPAWSTLTLSSASLGYTYIVFSQPTLHLPCLNIACLGHLPCLNPASLEHTYLVLTQPAWSIRILS